MCILFLYIAPKVSLGQWKVILVSNRDEYYTRPTEPLHLWSCEPQILAGMKIYIKQISSL